MESQLASVTDERKRLQQRTTELETQVAELRTSSQQEQQRQAEHVASLTQQLEEARAGASDAAGMQVQLKDLLTERESLQQCAMTLEAEVGAAFV
jgi:chromosome segregation ATPase